MPLLRIINNNGIEYITCHYSLWFYTCLAIIHVKTVTLQIFLTLISPSFNAKNTSKILIRFDRMDVYDKKIYIFHTSSSKFTQAKLIYGENTVNCIHRIKLLYSDINLEK